MLPSFEGVDVHCAEILKKSIQLRTENGYQRSAFPWKKQGTLKKSMLYTQ
jgi:hypothetical protein